MTVPTPPEINPLVVDVDEIATRLGLDMPVESGVADTIRRAILDAQADVESYLGRPIVPIQRVAQRLYHPGFIGYRYTSWEEQIDDDVQSIISVDPEVYPDSDQPTGTFTVTYMAGLDARNDPSLGPIRRHVSAAARNDPAVLDIWSDTVRPRGQLISVNVDGQSASFSRPWHGEGTMPGSGAPGALPTLTALYPWKRATVFQRRDSPFQRHDTIYPWWMV